MTSNISDLVKEYRPSMDSDVLHAWAKDMIASLSEPVVEVKEGYRVVADKFDCRFPPVPLSEAIHIRTADEVRREALEEAARVAMIPDEDDDALDRQVRVIVAADILALIDTPAQSPDKHPDDAAVDRFAAAMKAKLAKKREEGRGGWEGDACTQEVLSKMLREHVEKGDPVDVGNLAMMLHQRGESVIPFDNAKPSPEPVAWLMGEGEEAAAYTDMVDIEYLIAHGCKATPLYASPPDKTMSVAEADNRVESICRELRNAGYMVPVSVIDRALAAQGDG